MAFRLKPRVDGDGKAVGGGHRPGATYARTCMLGGPVCHTESSRSVVYIYIIRPRFAPRRWTASMMSTSYLTSCTKRVRTKRVFGGEGAAHHLACSPRRRKTPSCQTRQGARRPRTNACPAPALLSWSANCCGSMAAGLAASASLPCPFKPIRIFKLIRIRQAGCCPPTRWLRTPPASSCCAPSSGAGAPAPVCSRAGRSAGRSLLVDDVI